MSWGERFVTIALAASVLLAVVSVGYVFAVPQPGERFTDLRVMTESTGDGLTLGNYPDEIVVGEASGVTVGIDNREGRTQQYTVVITAEQLIQDGDSVTAIDSAEIDRFETTLEDGQRLLQPQTITPQSSGEIRINYYLYKGSAPEDPTVENAYRHVHFTTSAVNGGTTTGEDTTPDNGELEIDGSIDAAAAETEVIDGEPPALRPDR